MAKYLRIFCFFICSIIFIEEVFSVAGKSSAADNLSKSDQPSNADQRSNAEQPSYTDPPSYVDQPSDADLPFNVDGPSNASNAAGSPVATDSQKYKKQWPQLNMSKFAQNTVNPLLQTLALLNISHSADYAPIHMEIGDPTIYGNLRTSGTVAAGVHAALNASKFNGYAPSIGLPSARAAVARRYSTRPAPFTAADVVMTIGASQALQIAVHALASAGENVLVPQPGFPLYRALARQVGIETREYHIGAGNDSDNDSGTVSENRDGGLIDLTHLETLIDAKTKAIILNNPANPTGTVFPRAHLVQLLEIAWKHKVVVISDEIYGHLTYGANATFHPLAELSTRVPVLTCDGLTKRWLVPGWRLGWLIVHDRLGVLADVRRGIAALTNTLNGPSTLLQGALPHILLCAPRAHFDAMRQLLATNARIVYATLGASPNLRVERVHGALFMLVELRNVTAYGNITTFVQGLIRAKSVYTMPGFVFHAPNAFRILLTLPSAMMADACERIVDYCSGNNTTAAAATQPRLHQQPQQRQQLQLLQQQQNRLRQLHADIVDRFYLSSSYYTC